MIWPQVELEPCVTINTSSLECLGSQVDGGGGLNLANFASGQWISADTAMLFPFVLTKPITVVAMFSVTGSASNGDVAVGVYDRDFTKIISASSTQGAANSLQSFDVTDRTIGPGFFYLAINASSTTTTFFRGTISVTQILNGHGVAQATSTGTTLPAVASAASLSTALGYVPMFGLTTRSGI